MANGDFNADEVKKRAANERARERRVRAEKNRTSRGPDTRATTGNKGDAGLRKTFGNLRGKIRGFARSFGRGVGAGGVEAAGLASEVAGGIGEGVGGTEKIKQGASRAKQAASAAADATKKLPGRFAKGAGKLALKGAVKALPFAGVGSLAHQAFTKSPEELTAQSGIQQIEPLRGTGPGPTNLERPGDALLAGGQQAIGAIRGALGIEPDAVTAANDAGDVRNEAVQARAKAENDRLLAAGSTPGGLRKAQAGGNTPGSVAGQTTTAPPPGGVVPPGVQGAFRGAPSARGDVGPIAPTTPTTGNLVPAAGTGSFTNERTGAVTNLNFPQQAQQERGLRVAQQAPAQTQNEELTQKLADQARGGGIASAFGAIASGGNVLREQAANRQRQFQQQEQQSELKNKLDISIAKADAQNADLPLRQQQEISDRRRERLNAITAAEDSGNDDALNREYDQAFAGAINGDQADIPIANTQAAKEVAEIAGGGILDALLPEFLEKFIEGPDPVVPLDPSGTTFVDKKTGEIFKPDAKGGREKLADLNKLPPRTQDYFKSRGILQVADPFTGGGGGVRFQRAGPKSRGVIGR